MAIALSSDGGGEGRERASEETRTERQTIDDETRRGLPDRPSGKRSGRVRESRGGSTAGDAAEEMGRARVRRGIDVGRARGRRGDPRASHGIYPSPPARQPSGSNRARTPSAVRGRLGARATRTIARARESPMAMSRARAKRVARASRRRVRAVRARSVAPRSHRPRRKNKISSNPGASAMPANVPSGAADGGGLGHDLSADEGGGGGRDAESHLVFLVCCVGGLRVLKAWAWAQPVPVFRGWPVRIEPRPMKSFRTRHAGIWKSVV